MEMSDVQGDNKVDVESKSSYYWYSKIPSIKKYPRFPTLNTTTNLVYEILLEEEIALSVVQLSKMTTFHKRSINYAIRMLRVLDLIGQTISFEDGRVKLYYAKKEDTI